MQYLNESFSEFDVEGGVYDGVDSAVHIPQPGKGIVHFQWDDQACAEGLQNVSDEEWKPAYDKYTCRRHRKQRYYPTESASISQSKNSNTCSEALMSTDCG